MSGTNFNLRGIDPKVMTLLKNRAAKQHVSVNLLILKCIEQSIGYSRPAALLHKSHSTSSRVAIKTEGLANRHIIKVILRYHLR